MVQMWVYQWDDQMDASWADQRVQPLAIDSAYSWAEKKALALALPMVSRKAMRKVYKRGCLSVDLLDDQLAVRMADQSVHQLDDVWGNQRAS